MFGAFIAQTYPCQNGDDQEETVYRRDNHEEEHRIIAQIPESCCGIFFSPHCDMSSGKCPWNIAVCFCDFTEHVQWDENYP
jgi:hypothetical protein